ncbi:MAG: amidohydrolase family protein [Clostridiales bacterium]|nr:amidohydrolase family protein [Clostridiales bacterium]
MFIDVHAHAYKYPYPTENDDYLFITPEELYKAQDDLEIELSLINPVLGPELYVPQSVGEVIDMANDSGGRYIAMCNVDPRALTNSSDAPLGKLLEHYKALGCVGIGEVMPNLPWEDERMQNLLACVEKVELPLIFDMTGRINCSYGIYDKPGMPGLRMCLEKFPDLKFIGHGPSFWAEISVLRSPEDITGYPDYPVIGEGEMPKMLREYPNLYAELSAGSGYNALARDEENAVSFLNEFSDKLMYGTDICYSWQRPETASFLKRLRSEGKLSEDNFQKIAKGNAKALFKL